MTAAATVDAATPAKEPIVLATEEAADEAALAALEAALEAALDAPEEAEEALDAAEEVNFRISIPALTPYFSLSLRKFPFSDR